MTGEYAQMLVQCGDVQLGIYLEAKLPLVDRLKQNDFVACDDIGSHRFAVDRQLWEESFDHGEIEILDSVSNDFAGGKVRSEEHTSELQSLMRISYAVFCLKKKNQQELSTTYNRDKAMNNSTD